MEILQNFINNLITVSLVIVIFLAAVYDIKTHKIPNIVTLLPILFFVLYYTVVDGMNGFSYSVIGMITGVGLLIVPHIMGGMGAGDVKLMGAVGSFLGAKATFEAFILIAIAGGFYSVALILMRRDVFRGVFSEKIMVLLSVFMFSKYLPIQAQSKSSGQKPRLKYGVAIAFGTITYLLLNSFGIRFLP